MEARLEWNQVAGRCSSQGVRSDEERIGVAMRIGDERIFARNIPEVDMSGRVDYLPTLAPPLLLPQQASLSSTFLLVLADRSNRHQA